MSSSVLEPCPVTLKADNRNASTFHSTESLAENTSLRTRIVVSVFSSTNKSEKQKHYLSVPSSVLSPCNWRYSGIKYMSDGWKLSDRERETFFIFSIIFCLLELPKSINTTATFWMWNDWYSSIVGAAPRTHKDKTGCKAHVAGCRGQGSPRSWVGAGRH